jgi:dienelactone hydrolase
VIAWRATLALVFGVLALAGCAGVARNIDIPRPPAPFDSKPWPASVTGYLTRPDGEGPFPAVILLHGCSGLPGALRRLGEWAEWYRARGWASIILDSFGPRNIAAVCGTNEVTANDRANDAYAALTYLAGLPFVRKDQVVIQGLSHGGWTVLRALDEIAYGTHPRRFAAGVAYYPVCSGIRRPLYAPAIVLIGELDDWTPAPPCQSLHDRTREDAHPIDLAVYPGAYHSFDFPGPQRVNQYGKVLAHSADATTDAERRVDDFLRRLFPGR